MYTKYVIIGLGNFRMYLFFLLFLFHTVLIFTFTKSLESLFPISGNSIPTNDDDGQSPAFDSKLFRKCMVETIEIWQNKQKLFKRLIA